MSGGVCVVSSNLFLGKFSDVFAERECGVFTCTPPYASAYDSGKKVKEIVEEVEEEQFQTWFEYDELDEVVEDVDECCANCSRFNAVGSQFPTNHATCECLRCMNCKAWLKTRDRFMNHVCKGKQLCKFFAAGFCKNGSQCDFAHILPNSPNNQSNPQSNPQSNSQHLAKKDRNIFVRARCVFFDGKCGESGCNKGDDCAYKHGSDPCSLCGGEYHDKRHCVQCFSCGCWGHKASDCQKSKK